MQAMKKSKGKDIYVPATACPTCCGVSREQQFRKQVLIANLITCLEAMESCYSMEKIGCRVKTTELTQVFTKIANIETKLAAL